jgi:hypothetical protein
MGKLTWWAHSIVECFDFLGCLNVYSIGWFPLLCASLSVPIKLGVEKTIGIFSPGTICECVEVPKGSP